MNRIGCAYMGFWDYFMGFLLSFSSAVRFVSFLELGLVRFCGRMTTMKFVDKKIPDK